MNKKHIVLLVLLILLCINCVNATNTTKSDMQSQTNIEHQDNAKTTTVHETYNENHATEDDDEKISINAPSENNDKKAKTISETDTLQDPNEHYKIINDTNYHNYFNTNGDIINDNIQDGDTIDISGTITNKNFNINRQVIFTSSNNGKIINGTIKLTEGASNSILSNLTIQNSQTGGIGFLLNGVSHVEISNNYLQMNGFGAYGIGVTHSSHIRIINNTIKETPTSTGSSHVPILLGDSHYNTISQNDLEIIVQTPYNQYISLNGIYLSNYGGGAVDGGYCHYNNITNNTIKGFDSVWCYTIQMMGDNNIAANNNVSGGSIGVSSSGANNQIINNTIHATATGIVATEANIVTGNTIKLNDGATGISIAADNTLIQENRITTTNEAGINIKGSNNIIKKNTITTDSGSGISVTGFSNNNTLITNTINSHGTGILFKKWGPNPNNTIIQNNFIKTTALYAIDAYQSENTIIYPNNDLESSNGTGDAAVRHSSTNSGGYVGPDSNKVYNLTDNNYFDYFDENGYLRPDVIGRKDTLNLTTSIYNKNMTIDIPITINGNQNTIYNGTITILQDGSETTINNLKIQNDNQKGIILYETENVNIENNIISVNHIDESYGIYLFGSEYSRIINNTITSYGDYVNFGIFLYSSNYNRVLKNHVNTISNDIETKYQSNVMLNNDIGQIPQIFTTYGIIAIFASNNQINENTVNLTSQFTEPKNVTENCSNSMVGIDIYYDSHYNTVNNNHVTVIGNNPYSYGMGVLGSDIPTGSSLETAKGNAFENNEITVFGNYFATGFIAGLGSVDTIIKNNTIIISSNTFTYGITLEASQRSKLTSNNITLNSPAIYGIEAYSSNKNIINGNIINATGSYSYGIAGYAISKNEITNNTITTKGMNTTTAINEVEHSDSIPIGNAGIILIKNSTDNLIKLNKITTDNEYTINITNSTNNTITENSLLAKQKISSESIFSESNNQITNNEGYSLTISMNNMNAKPGNTITLKATVTSTSGNNDGFPVVFTIGLTTIGTSITENGIAELTYKIPNNWKITYYPLKASVSGENYITKTITKTLELKNPTTYDLTDDTYSMYFDENGYLKHDLIGLRDTINIKSPLYNKNMTIDIPITINGNQNTIYNGTITILQDGSNTTINNLKIQNDNQKGIILYETENNTLINNELTVNHTNESYGIYSYESSHNKIINNTITSYGDYVNFGIFLYSSQDNEVLKNHVNTISNDIEVRYLNEITLTEIGDIPQIFTTHGILAIYSSNNQINENTINLTSQFTEPKNVTENCRNTMSGLNICYGSDDNTIKNNQISVIGNNPYSYGAIILGSDCNPTGNALETAKRNILENNKITVFGNYFATGIKVGLGSINTILKNNQINVDSNIKTNGIELFASNKTNILGNNINAKGYYKYGILGDSTLENEITNNIITTKTTKTAPSITDSSSIMPLGNAGILLYENSLSNLIKSNKITTDNEYTINITNSQNNTITENSLISKSKLANPSIISDSNNKIGNNEGYTLTIHMNDVSAKQGTTITLKATVTSTSGNSNGLKVTFMIGQKVIGTSITKNGVAELKYTIPSNSNIGNYAIKASVSGENYITKTISKTLKVSKADPKKPNVTLILNKIKTVSKRAKKLVLKATLKVNGILSKNQKLTFKFNGKTFTTKTNNKGIAKYTIKQSVLKSILKKVKVGKTIPYQVTYKTKAVTKTVKTSVKIKK